MIKVMWRIDVIAIAFASQAIAYHYSRFVIDEVTVEEFIPKLCQSYNDLLAGSMSCECSLFDDNQQGLIDCKYIQPLCASDNVTCIDGGMSIYLLRNTSVSKVRTCTEPTSTARNLATCVDMFPAVPGNFSELASCSIELMGQPCQMCRVCDNRTVMVNCSNVEPTAVQSECLPVNENGAFFPNFDFFDEGPTSMGSVKLVRYWMILVPLTLTLRRF